MAERKVSRFEVLGEEEAFGGWTILPPCTDAEVPVIWTVAHPQLPTASLPGHSHRDHGSEEEYPSFHRSASYSVMVEREGWVNALREIQASEEEEAAVDSVGDWQPQEAIRSAQLVEHGEEEHAHDQDGSEDMDEVDTDEVGHFVDGDVVDTSKGQGVERDSTSPGNDSAVEEEYAHDHDGIGDMDEEDTDVVGHFVDGDFDDRSKGEGVERDSTCHGNDSAVEEEYAHDQDGFGDMDEEDTDEVGHFVDGDFEDRSKGEAIERDSTCHGNHSAVEDGRGDEDIETSDEDRNNEGGEGAMDRRTVGVDKKLDIVHEMGGAGDAYAAGAGSNRDDVYATGAVCSRDDACEGTMHATDSKIDLVHKRESIVEGSCEAGVVGASVIHVIEERENAVQCGPDMAETKDAGEKYREDNILQKQVVVGDGKRGGDVDKGTLHTRGYASMISKHSSSSAYPAWGFDPSSYKKPVRPLPGNQILKTKQIRSQQIEQQRHQPQHKIAGLIWRISLIATMGLLGWGFLSGGGINLHCFTSLYPCSIHFNHQPHQRGPYYHTDHMYQHPRRINQHHYQQQPDPFNWIPRHADH